MIRQEAIKKAQNIAKRIKDIVYVLCDENCGYQDYFTLTQDQYDNSQTADESMITLAYDQYGQSC